MKNRLIELLEKADETIMGFTIEGDFGILADHLLANGVIVPQIKVGQKIYRCDFVLKKVIDWIITRIDVYEDAIVYCDDSYNVFTDEEIGDGVFLTKAEAEKALAERGHKCEES